MFVVIDTNHGRIEKVYGPFSFQQAQEFAEHCRANMPIGSFVVHGLVSHVSDLSRVPV
jgi:hypothetical protein